MAKTINEKRLVWTARIAMALGITEDAAADLLRTERQQSLRLNPLRAKPADIIQELQAVGWQGSAYAWMSDGYTIETPVEQVRDSTALAEGRAFIQNAASWLPVLALAPQSGEEILDVCAAPGGKTSHIAVMTGNHARITANDNSRTRLAKLRANLARLGVAGVEYTLYDATQLARKLDGRRFDRILLDAPCSGEGMMHLDRDKDFATWSVAHIKRLQQLQKRLIGQAWQLLRPGGTLVYSTCTMAPEENEAVASYLLRTQDDAELLPFELSLPNRVPAVTAWNGREFDPAVTACLRLKPSRHVEAFFVAKFVKISD